jgi:hypothetical protein
MVRFADPSREYTALQACRRVPAGRTRLVCACRRGSVNLLVLGAPRRCRNRPSPSERFVCVQATTSRLLHSSARTRKPKRLASSSLERAGRGGRRGLPGCAGDGGARHCGTAGLRGPPACREAGTPQGIGFVLPELLAPPRAELIGRQIHDEPDLSTVGLTRGSRVQSRTSVLLGFRIELPSVTATGRWRERGRMGRSG